MSSRAESIPSQEDFQENHDERSEQTSAVVEPNGSSLGDDLLAKLDSLEEDLEEEFEDKSRL